LSGLAIALGGTAILAGVTGSWSPCGFSMISTLGPGGHSGGMRTTLAACATFSLGALIGGAVTFLGLAALGALIHPAGAGIHGAAAAAIAGAAALGEARGVRIVPQIRRQVPEHWRRIMPLALAGGLYGILLGLGFTTFVLTLAVWALAGIAVAAGDPGLGLLIGLCFGAGRALPILVLAPISETDRGVNVVASMAERPALLRGLRLADGAALLLCALTLATGSAFAANVLAEPATDPSVGGSDVAWQQPGAAGILARGVHRVPLPGRDPALSGSLAAWRNDDRVTIAQRATLTPIRTLAVAGIRKLAISDRWLAYRAVVSGGREVIGARRVDGTGRPRIVATVRAPAQLGRPDVNRDVVVFDVATGGESDIVDVNLRNGRRGVLRRSTSAQFLNPSITDSKLLYVLVGRCTQQLRLGSFSARRRERVLFSTGCGTSALLWTTALSTTSAYLTRLDPRSDGSTAASLLRVGR
jgi:hypothetical protein